MNTTFLIARRYLLSRKSHSVVNIISMVSLVSLLIPVAAVIILLSIFNGFSRMIGEFDRAVEGDLTVELRAGKLFDGELVAREDLEAVDGVDMVSHLTEQTLLLRLDDRSAVLTLRGVDDYFTYVTDVEDHIIMGDFEVELGDLERVVVGNAVASRLGVRSLVDTHIDIYALKSGGLQSLIPIGSYRVDRAKLAGIFSLDQLTEERYAYTSQRLVNGLLGSSGQSSKVAIKVSDGADIERVKSDVEGVVGGDFSVKSRSELNPAIYNIIKYEKLGVLLITSLVMLLASFSLLGALTMLVIEKRGDIATLRAMGWRRSDIRYVFICEGLLISGAAIAVGLMLGVIFTLIQQYIGVIELPSASMVIQYYPVELQLGDIFSVVAMTATISIVICWVVVNSMLKRKNFEQ